MTGTVPTPLAPLVQRFFSGGSARGQRQHDASYRDTFGCTSGFAGLRCGKAPTDMDVSDIDVDLVAEFLEHLETERGIVVKSRYVRLAAIRNLLQSCRRQRAAGPARRTDPACRASVTTGPPPGSRARSSRRQRARSRHVVRPGAAGSAQTGLRVSDDRPQDRDQAARSAAKGARTAPRPCGAKRQRSLKPGSTRARWTTAVPQQPRRPAQPRRGRAPRHGIAVPLRRPVPRSGTRGWPSSRRSHGCCMTVSGTVIALWLGHESAETTQVYLHADLRWRGQSGPGGSSTTCLLSFLKSNCRLPFPAGKPMAPQTRHNPVVGDSLCISA